MDQITALILATAVLVAIPGPNVAFIVAVSLRHGFRAGALVVAGTTLGIGIQLSFVTLGLAAILTIAANVMVWLKWAGVIYLLWLGFRAWRTPVPAADEISTAERPSFSSFWQGLGIAVINPKTLMFNAAFLPQFLPVESGPGRVATVALIYLAVLFVGDLAWAGLARSVRGLSSKFRHLRNRLAGGFLFGAGVGLALARIHD